MISCQLPDLSAPDGCIVAVLEEGQMRFAAPGVARLSDQDAFPASIGNYVLDRLVEALPRVPRTRAISGLVRLRGAGATIVLLTHDEGLMEAYSPIALLIT